MKVISLFLCCNIHHLFRKKCFTILRVKIGASGYLQDVDEDHGVGDVAVELLLLGQVGQINEGPGHDARAAIEEQLEVEPLADARVEFNAHHVVVEKVTCEFAAVAKMTNDGMSQDRAAGEKISTAVTGRGVNLFNSIIASIRPHQ